MTIEIICGDVFEKLAELPDNHFDCVVTSPPYWALRDYGVDGQIGMEATMDEHIDVILRVFAELRRVITPHATVWLNYGDMYASTPNGKSAAQCKEDGSDDCTFRDKPFSSVQGSLKPKDLVMMPNRIAIALQEAGWWVRSEIIWAKPNPMPTSVKDRPGCAHEKIFLLTKSPWYFYDHVAVRIPSRHNGPVKMPDGWDTAPGTHGTVHRKGREKGKTDKQRGHGRQHAGFNARWDKMSKEEQQAAGRNLRNYEPAPVEIWNIATKGFKEAHFATFPPELVKRCLTAGVSAHGYCGGCGAPFVRVTDKALTPTAKAAKTCVIDQRDDIADGLDQGSNRQKDGHMPGHASAYTTTGWAGTCECPNVLPRAGRVLDPFGGSGTTGLVADQMQMDCTLIEINPDYCEIIRKRIADDAGMFR